MGIPLGVIEVEAAERSGALITARHGMEQGRDMFAVPGNVDSRASRGCHRLLRDGAILVESADDVPEQLGPLVEAASRDDGRKVHHPAELLLNDPFILGCGGGKMKRVTMVAQAVVLLLCLSVAARADEKLPPRAARSVHLSYAGPKADMFYNELTVEKSVAGSYFMACGFRHGYFGIQEQGQGRKVVLFSVWDPGKGDNPNQVPEKERVEVLYHAADVVARRFGGEGTGGQSFFQYSWKVGETYRFLVKAATAENKTSFAAYFYLPEKKTWKHLVTFRTIAGGARLESPYSFIEDFRRDGQSANEVRRALFGNAWVGDSNGSWTPLEKARFTASGASWEAKDTIDAGAVRDRFYLQTGGDTHAGMKLNGWIACHGHGKQPPELPK